MSRKTGEKPVTDPFGKGSITQLKWDVSYGCKFTPSIPKEHACLDGIIIHNSNDHITNNYDINNGRRYGKLTAGTMGVCRVLGLKQAIKLCRHYNEKKRKEDGYNLCQKKPD